jgi:hypothetical protein
LESRSAARIKESSSRDYFLGEEEKAIEEWAQRAKKIFEYFNENIDSQEMFLKANTK